MKLRNCRLIPELSGMNPLRLADIELDGGKISRIQAAAGQPAGPDEFDCGGKTLLPGLFDLHAHVSLRSGREVPEDGMNRLLDAMETVQEYTKRGITTIRDCGSTLHLAIALRNAIGRGIVKGPRVQACGYMLGPQSMYMLGRVYMTVMDIVNTEGEMLAAARKQLALGADFVKIYASDSASQCAQKSPKAILRREEIRAAVEAAEMAGSYVAAHAHSLDSIRLCLQEGVRTIEHASLIDEAAIRALKGMEDVYLVPTLAVTAPKGEEETGSIKSMMRQKTMENISRAYQAGLKLGFGTDLSNGDLSGFYQEFELRKNGCGMSSIDILLQATRYSAQIAGLGGVTGEIREGLAADLILVDGNPDEDISVMKQKPLAVIQGGEMLIGALQSGSPQIWCWDKRS
ncbi:MAG: amidohydrolase family protein [Lachnospiraceae bacterium]|nr:amidohydrolase family protein [Lachnospiraceae bacterium]